MEYKLIITEYAEKSLDNLVNHLLIQLQNEQAVIHLLNGINAIYIHLRTNPCKFPISKNLYLANKGYREALVPHMKYVIVFRISDNTIYIMGVFHQLENYTSKL